MQRVFPPARSSSIVVWWIGMSQPLCEADDPFLAPRRITRRSDPWSAIPELRYQQLNYIPETR